MSSIAAADPEHTIAFMGMEGANADLACRQACPYMHTLALASFEDVFEAVESGRAAVGMIPIENSQAGRVAEIHHLLPNAQLHIVGEFFQPVEHCLLAPKGASLKTVREVYSHPQALLQCRKRLREMSLAARPHSNTAQAAADVARWNDPAKAALASPLAGQLYGLETLKAHMQDDSDNMTVFVLIARQPVDPDPDRERVLTSLLFSLRNIPAALYKALGGFATNHVNMLKLESYIPAGKKRASAQFFLTCEGHPRQAALKHALEELRFFCDGVRVLGVYPAAPARFKQ